MGKVYKEVKTNVWGRTPSPFQPYAKSDKNIASIVLHELMKIVAH